MQNKAPVFVKVEEYRDVLDVINLLNDKITEAKSTLAKINNLKAKEDSEVETWQANLNDVEHKIGLIDKSLFEVKDV